jgi:hypothetical protein
LKFQAGCQLPGRGRYRYRDRSRWMSREMGTPAYAGGVEADSPGCEATPGSGDPRNHLPRQGWQTAGSSHPSGVRIHNRHGIPRVRASHDPGLSAATPPAYSFLGTGDWHLATPCEGRVPHPARPSPHTPSVTPEALQPIAPGWRDRAYPGSCVWRSTHPEGGAKIPAPSCNPSRVGDPFRRFPGCASRPRATRFNASGVANTPDHAGNWRLASGNSPSKNPSPAANGSAPFS